MLKKTIKTKNFNDEEYEIDVYFNLTEAELLRRELNEVNGEYESMQDKINAISLAQSGRVIMDEMEAVLRLSYGKKSPDGIQFIKNEAVWQEFFQSNHYSAFFMDLVTDAKFAAEFIRGIMPAGFELTDEQFEEAARKSGLVKNGVEGTPRERSEAQMQGHRPPANTPQQVTDSPAQPAPDQPVPDTQPMPAPSTTPPGPDPYQQPAGMPTPGIQPSYPGAQGGM